MNISDLTFREVLALHIPCEVFDEGIRKTATYRRHTPSGGSGMGEYPAEVMLVLSDGRVYEWGEWSEVNKPRLVSYHKGEQRKISF